MDAEKLRQLLARKEKLNLEFKLTYALSGQGRSKIQDEVAKDILGLVNSTRRHIDDYAYLVIGVGERMQPDGKRQREDVREYGYSKRNFLDIVNARCTPALSDLDYDEIELDGNYYGVIVIRPSPHIHYLTRDLDTPKGSWRKNSVLIRHGDEVGIAPPEEIALISRQKEQWQQQAGGIKDLMSTSITEFRESILRLIAELEYNYGVLENIKYSTAPALRDELWKSVSDKLSNIPDELRTQLDMAYRKVRAAKEIHQSIQSATGNTTPELIDIEKHLMDVKQVIPSIIDGLKARLLGGEY